MRFNIDKKSKMQFVTLKDDEYFTKLKHSGMVVAKCLQTFKERVDSKTPNLNLKDIEAECVEIIEKHECIPTFKGYKGFPGFVCLSVNKELVHGIPRDYILKEGDVVTLDLGAHTECGVIADAAVSAIYGEPLIPKHVELLKVCEEALYKAISIIKVGNRLGCIGNAIHRHTRDKGFSLVTKYAGHGIDRGVLHSQPIVLNKSRCDDGIHIQSGLTIAIEPMLILGTGNSKTNIKKDKWTVCGKNISAHYEHTIFVKEGGVEIMTM